MPLLHALKKPVHRLPLWELPDGRIVTGKTSDLLGASAALILNALKELAGIDHDMHLISPTALEPSRKSKPNSLEARTQDFT